MNTENANGNRQQEANPQQNQNTERKGAETTETAKTNQTGEHTPAATTIATNTEQLQATSTPSGTNPTENNA